MTLGRLSRRLLFSLSVIFDHAFSSTQRMTAAPHLVFSPNFPPHFQYRFNGVLILPPPFFSHNNPPCHPTLPSICFRCIGSVAASVSATCPPLIVRAGGTSRRVASVVIAGASATEASTYPMHPHANIKCAKGHAGAPPPALHSSPTRIFSALLWRLNTPVRSQTFYYEVRRLRKYIFSSRRNHPTPIVLSQVRDVISSG